MLLEECQSRGHISWPEKHTHLAPVSPQGASWLASTLSLSVPLGKSPLFGAGGFLEMIPVLGAGALSRSRRKVQLLKRCALGIHQPLCPSCQCISHQEHVGHFPNENVGSLFETKHVTGC